MLRALIHLDRLHIQPGYSAAGNLRASRLSVG